jgi:hypothetical protein
MIHVIISLIGIASGFIVVYELLTSKRLGGWNTLFLVTTVLTTVTGFMFPISTITPALITGGVSSLILVIALCAIYIFRLGGRWRATYVITALMALWLNSFVGVVQTFQKIGFFNRFAPTQSEPPFLVAQLALLALFVVLGFLAVKRYRPAI